MEKFDTTITNAKNDYQPRADFVDRTMHQITPKRRPRFALWGALLTSGVALAALALIMLPHGSGTTPAPLNAPTGQQTVADQSTGATDNATLASDLSSIKTAMNAAATDQASADAALNDSQQQIAVPTE